MLQRTLLRKNACLHFEFFQMINFWKNGRSWDKAPDKFSTSLPLDTGQLPGMRVPEPRQGKEKDHPRKGETEEWLHMGH